MDGLDVVRGLRGWTSVPIVVLSGRGTEAAKVEALDLGADDYLTKPFGMDELFARLRAAVRRAVLPEGKAVLTTPDFTIDFVAKQVRRGDELVRLTPTQWHIVEVLVRNAGRLVTYEQVLREVWGPTYGKETNYLRVFMTQIRHKLEPEPSTPRYFITEPGLGFRFEAPERAEDGTSRRWLRSCSSAGPRRATRACAWPAPASPCCTSSTATRTRRAPTTCLEDWVRIPGDDRDLSARVAALELPSRPPTRPRRGSTTRVGSTTAARRLTLSPDEARLGGRAGRALR